MESSQLAKQRNKRRAKGNGRRKDKLAKSAQNERNEREDAIVDKKRTRKKKRNRDRERKDGGVGMMRRGGSAGELETNAMDVRRVKRWSRVGSAR